MNKYKAKPSSRVDVPTGGRTPSTDVSIRKSEPLDPHVGGRISVRNSYLRAVEVPIRVRGVRDALDTTADAPKIEFGIRVVGFVELDYDTPLVALRWTSTGGAW